MPSRLLGARRDGLRVIGVGLCRSSGTPPPMYEPKSVLMWELVGLVRLVGLARWSGERGLWEMGRGGGGGGDASGGMELSRLECYCNWAGGGYEG